MAPVRAGFTRQDEASWALPREHRPPPFSVLDRSAGDAPRFTAHPRRILVVEDNLDSMHSLVFVLRDIGHEVEFAINGYVALEIAERMQPHFVLLDLGLPGLDGYYVCRRIKDTPSLKETRVVVISGYASEEARTRSKAAGCELHLVKPVSPRALEAVLESPRPQTL